VASAKSGVGLWGGEGETLVERVGSRWISAIWRRMNED